MYLDRNDERLSSLRIFLRFSIIVFWRRTGKSREFNLGGYAVEDLRFLVFSAFCSRRQPPVAGQRLARSARPEVPAVSVSHPVERMVTDYVDFTGRTKAVESVNIVARVTGYLQMPFKEGSEVKAGEILFEIDPRPYEAQYDQAKSQVDLDEAQLNLAKTTLDRYVALAKSTPGAVSEQALDQYKAAVAEAEARVVAQKKSLDVYKLNQDFTKVVSPIDGQVSRYYYTRETSSTRTRRS